MTLKSQAFYGAARRLEGGTPTDMQAATLAHVVERPPWRSSEMVTSVAYRLDVTTVERMLKECNSTSASRMKIAQIDYDPMDTRIFHALAHGSTLVYAAVPRKKGCRVPRVRVDVIGALTITSAVVAAKPSIP
jgi:hypothetical protein